MKNKWTLLLVFVSVFTIQSQTQNAVQDTVLKADIVIYGGTSAAVIAAVKAAQLGQSVIVISPDNHLGGMTSSGLGFTDVGNTSIIGGLAKQFYQKIFSYYQNDAAWNWQKKNSFKNKAQHTRAIDNKNKTMWVFEPHVAEAVFNQWLTDSNITVYKNEWLDRDRKIIKEGNKIISFYTLSNKKVTGKVFIDCTYEGDLMVVCGVTYNVGRESNATYNEKHNGIQKGIFHHEHNFQKFKIDPYIIPKDPNSGLLPKISKETPGRNGDGDNRIQAYCFRMCLTKVPENRIPFEKPEDYNPGDYQILVRMYQQGWKSTFKKFDPIPNLKTDVNNHGPFSFDNIGMNYRYPDGSYAERKQIISEHERYQKGLLYFIANDPAVPKNIRDEISKWGFAKDEFKDNGGFPTQLYIREARRMVGEYVMTEHDVIGEHKAPESIGMGSYHLDSHNTQRYVTNDGWVENEGDIGIKPKKPYRIARGAILPKASECSNLIVPVCVSSSHIAYGSIRMEPVFMILAESATQIAALAVQKNSSVQEITFEEISPLLLESGQMLN